MKSHDYAESVALDILSKTPSYSFVIAGRRVAYDTKTKKWSMLAVQSDYSFRRVFEPAPWSEVKDKVIEFFCQKPEFEREFLRAKQEETLTAPRPFEAL